MNAGVRGPDSEDNGVLVTVIAVITIQCSWSTEMSLESQQLPTWKPAPITSGLYEATLSSEPAFSRDETITCACAHPRVISEKCSPMICLNL